MVSNFARPITAHAENGARPKPEGLSGRVLERVKELLCGLSGHDNLLQFQHDRMFLRCASCGHETRGWELNEVPPTPLARPEPRRQAIPKPRLVRDRRIA
jgi:hypothetical protein